jgi:hypothetical protein
MQCKSGNIFPNRLPFFGKNASSNRLRLKQNMSFVVMLTSADCEFCRKKSIVLSGGSKHASNTFLNLAASLSDLEAAFFNMAFSIDRYNNPP